MQISHANHYFKLLQSFAKRTETIKFFIYFLVFDKLLS